MHPQVSMADIETDRIAPVVLRSTLFSAGTSFPAGFRLGTRHVYDYELEYFLFGGGAIMIDGVEWPVAKGDVCFRRPGQHVGGIMPYNCILICFDLLGNTGKNPVGYDFEHVQAFQPYYRNPVLDVLPHVFRPGAEGVRVLFETILRLYLEDGDSARLQLKGCMLHLLNRLFLEARFPADAQDGRAVDPDGRVRETIAYIRTHLAEPISLGHLASFAGLSPTHFHKRFRQVIREPVNAHVTRLRMEKARECLVETDWPVHRVGAACGYPNPSHFGWLFHKWVGMSPGEYKRLHRYV